MEEPQTPQPEPKILASCPACGQIVWQGEKSVISHYLMPGPGGKGAQISMPRITCLNCGIEFFPPEVLAELKIRIANGGSRIVVPKPKLNLVKN